MSDGRERAERGACIAACLRALLALWLALAGSQALAHAALLHSEPADGATLARAPAAVTLTFNEPVAPTSVHVVGPGHPDLAPRAIHVRGAAVTVELPPLGEGTHALSWRVISTDGHPVGGVVAFAVGAAAPAPVAAGAPLAPALAAAIWAARVVLYLGLFAGVGGAFFRTWIDAAQPAAARRAVDLALAAGLLAAATSPGLQGADMLGAPWLESASPHAWRIGMGSSFGLTLGIAACAMVLALAGNHLRAPRRARAASLLALLGVGLALAASGHAGTAPPQWLARPAVFLHTLGAALWIGALAPLAAALRTGGPAGRCTLSRFSRWVVAPLCVLVAAGVVLASVQLRQPSDLLATGYGRVLAAKLALVTAVLALAAGNRWRLTEGVLRERSGAARRLRRAILVELSVMAGVLGVVALWRFTPPPRALAAAAHERPAIHLQLHDARAMVDLVLEPGQAGPVSIAASVTDHAFAPLAAREVAFTLANPGAGIEAIHARATHAAGALWRADRVLLPAAGRWTISVAVLLDEFTQARLEGTVRLDP